MSALLYPSTVVHERLLDPGAGRFEHALDLWLVDVDDLPRLPRPLRPLARFRSADHLGDPARTLRQNVEAFLDGHGVDLGGGRIRMLAAARTLGHVFNP